MGPIEHLVCEQEIIAQARGRHSLDLAHRRAGKCPVAGIGETLRERRRLEGFDVGTQS